MNRQAPLQHLRFRLIAGLLFVAAAFTASLFLLELPTLIERERQAQHAIQALDHVRPPLLELVRTLARPQAPGAETLERLLAEADARIRDYVDAMRFDPGASRAASAFAARFADWTSRLRRLAEHVRDPGTGSERARARLELLSRDFAALLELLATGEPPLHAAMRKGQQAESAFQVLAVLALLAAAGIVFAYQRAVTRLIRHHQQHLEVTLNSIGDAVITTDIHGRVERMNPIAEHLTGWGADEARGRGLTEVFRIVNARTEKPVDNPVTRVLEKGEIVGLANDTLLIARGGERFQIHDSAAPIRDPEGRIVGVVLVFRDITEEYRLRNRAEEQSRRLEAVIRNALDAILIADGEGRILEWNPAAECLFGWKRQEVIGRHVHETIVPERWRPRHLEGMRRFLATGTDRRLVRRDDLTALRRDGTEFPVELTIVPIHRSSGWLFAAFLRDLTELRKAQEELRLAATTFQTHAGILITDAEGTILRVNPAYEAMTGYRADELIGKNPRILQSGRQDRAFYREMWERLRTTGQWQGELWNRRKDGKLYAQILTITAVRDEEGRITHYIGTSQDITALKEAQAEVEYRAHHDDLTGLPNRRLLHERLEQELVLARRHGSHAALLYLDLDRFTQINDTAGHAVGDVILRETADRLQALLHQQEVLARIASDEFAILLPTFDADLTQTGVVAQALAERIQATLASPFVIGDLEYFLGASIGIVLFPEGDESADDLMGAADNALHRAKEDGGGSIRFYQPNMQASARNRLHIEKSLRRALDRDDELELHYQPQVDESGRIQGAEVLLRWRHPQDGWIPPLHFIPIAEESGLVNELGLWVLRHACRQVRAWLDEGLPEEQVRFAVNVSPRQFAVPGFVEETRDLLAELDVPPRLLEIEITESTLMQDVGETIEKLSALRDLDITVAIDDFGTGYSSMSYLKRLPVDRLKIDRSFVSDLHKDPGDARIVETIIGMAHHLGLGVVAEGVETEAQMAFLVERECDFLQGYYFSRPVPAREYRTLLAAGRLPLGVRREE